MSESSANPEIRPGPAALTVRARLLYGELCVQHAAGAAGRRYEFDELREIMDAEGRYPKWHTLRRDLLTPALDAINAAGLVHVMMRPEKSPGIRSVTAVRLAWRWRSSAPPRPESDPGVSSAPRSPRRDVLIPPPDVDPLVACLMSRLPQPGDESPRDERLLWLEALEAALNLVFQPPQEPSRQRPPPPPPVAPPDVDPLVACLMSRMPQPGDNWPLDDRKRWLVTLDSALDLVCAPQLAPGRLLTHQTTPDEPGELADRSAADDFLGP